MAEDQQHRRLVVEHRCIVCGQQGHARTDHRFTTTCSWPLGCPAEAHRGLEGKNVFGQFVRNYYCEDHLRDIASGDAYRRTVDQTKRLGISSDLTRPDIIAANDALRAHQRGCPKCEAVRQWTHKEMAAGRVQTIEDRDRVGRYTIENACDEGIVLYGNVGRVMMT